jgi:hypothetical protein
LATSVSTLAGAAGLLVGGDAFGMAFAAGAVGFWGALGAGFAAGLAAGLGAGLAAALGAGFAAGLLAGLGTGLATGFAADFVAGLAAGLATLFATGFFTGFGATFLLGFVVAFALAEDFLAAGFAADFALLAGFFAEARAGLARPLADALDTGLRVMKTGLPKQNPGQRDPVENAEHHPRQTAGQDQRWK